MVVLFVSGEPRSMVDGTEKGFGAGSSSNLIDPVLTDRTIIIPDRGLVNDCGILALLRDHIRSLRV